MSFFVGHWQMPGWPVRHSVQMAVVGSWDVPLVRFLPNIDRFRRCWAANHLHNATGYPYHSTSSLISFGPSCFTDAFNPEVSALAYFASITFLISGEGGYAWFWA